MSLTVPYRWRSTSMGLARLAALLGLALFATVPQPARAAGYSDMIIDVNSGKIVHETNADEARFPASLAKIMTLYVTFDMIERKRLNLDTDLVISDYDANAQPSKLGLHTGDKIRVSDAIKALVTASANDVARAIAENCYLSCCCATLLYPPRQAHC